VKRYGQMRVDSSRVYRDASGYLHADADITATGVFPYRFPDGRVQHELRHPDDVFATESVATLKRRPITAEHPARPLDATNTRAEIIGVAGDDIRADQSTQTVRGTLTFFDSARIDAIERGGVTGLSGGYVAEVVPESGIFQMPGHPDDGKRYDARHTKIKYNHIAHTMSPRMGDRTQLRLDSGDAIADDLADACQIVHHKDERGDSMPLKFRRDQDRGEEAEEKITAKDGNDDANVAGSEGTQASQAKPPEQDDDGERDDSASRMAGRSRSMEQRLDALERELERIRGERDQLRQDAEQLRDPKRIAELAAERERLIAVGRHLRVEGHSTRFDGLDNPAIRRLIVAAKSRDDVKGLSDDNIAGRYQMIYDSVAGEVDALDSLRTLADATGATQRPDENDPAVRQDANELSPRARYIERAQNAWKKEGGGNATA